MAHHVEIRGRGAFGAGECAGIERAANRGARLIRDTLQKPGISHVFEEHGTDALLADELYQADDILRGRLGFRAESLRCDEGEPVVAAEILECVM